MATKRHKWLAVLAVAVCLAAQVFVVLPHHHHGESEVPCFNVVHCITHETSHEGHADPAGCCHEHCMPEADPVSGHECAVKVDIPELVNIRQYSALLDVITAINDFHAPEIITAPEFDNTLSTFTLTRRRQMPFVPDVCAWYLAEVLSARAPSCLV